MTSSFLHHIALHFVSLSIVTLSNSYGSGIEPEYPKTDGLSPQQTNEQHHSTNTATMSPQVKIGDYLFQRLAQLGIKTVWGVPGGAFTRPYPAILLTH
jgi:hypothetical protein